MAGVYDPSANRGETVPEQKRNLLSCKNNAEWGPTQGISPAAADHAVTCIGCVSMLSISLQ